MSYRIDYSSGRRHRSAGDWICRPLTLVLLLLAALNGIHYCSGNLSHLREKLMPWTQPRVQAAVVNMREEIAGGQPIYEAVAAFCRELTDEDTESNE